MKRLLLFFAAICSTVTMFAAGLDTIHSVTFNILAYPKAGDTVPQNRIYKDEASIAHFASIPSTAKYKIAWVRFFDETGNAFSSKKFNPTTTYKMQVEVEPLNTSYYIAADANVITHIALGGTFDKQYDWTNRKAISVNFTTGESGTVAIPEIRPCSNNRFNDYQTITLTCATEGASIYYTIDGSTPSATNGTLYVSPFVLLATGSDVTVKAIAVKGEKSSEVLIHTYETHFAYYNLANGKSNADNALRVALYDIISYHTVIDYGDLKASCYAASTDPSDFNNGDDNTLEDIYSSFVYKSSQGGASAIVCGQGWNKEHSLPKSWFGDESPMYSDAFHIYPTDIYMNSLRSNYPYGETDADLGCENYGYCALGLSNRSGYSGTVFEPRETDSTNYKGDLARSYFYMLTCYMTTNFTQADGGRVMFTYIDSIADFSSYGLDLMLEWNREDPVSEKERIRNNAIYAHQGNRNPFIDYPCLAEYIWGNKKGKVLNLGQLMSSYDAAFDGSDKTGCHCTITTPTLISPSNDSTFNVGSANVNETASKILTLQGVLLTKDVTLSISGVNASMFSLSTTSVLPTESGVDVTISYTPTTVGTHSATLTISSSEFDAVTITLTGSSDGTDNIKQTSVPSVYYTISGNQLYVQNVTAGATLSLYDCVGRMLEQRTACQTTESFVLGSGVYILQVSTPQGKRSMKIIR